MLRPRFPRLLPPDLLLGRQPCPCAPSCFTRASPPHAPAPHCSDPEKLACCEQCLHLAASQLWAPGPAGREAAYAVEGQAGLGVLLRALLTATELVMASAADDSWQVGASAHAA